MMSFRDIYDRLSGKCLRKIDKSLFEDRPVYLTFDDGPDPNFTEDVLKVLEAHNARATFFLISKRALEHKNLTRTIINNGHSVGNHSQDHNTNMFFKNYRAIKIWIQESETQLSNELNVTSVGVRTPLGIKTPALNRALAELSLPNVLWDIRFYDTNRLLIRSRVKRGLSNISPGSIILLHDTQEMKRRDIFLESLNFLILNCKEKGLNFKSLTKELVSSSYRCKYGS